ncbi:MAG: NAD(P)H-binding protein [Thiohalocapsa sp.]|jgi:NADH dehydrogenase|uniref:NAD(P)H-binding protein n=1 Tax=Thiohalocapsa sp. TaxID=2497641 RepID=UPI0025CD3BD6|nr:NAD(P)H-binding protein [Thiohalocapsa sp.]MCG6941697.1 NAD(P)H-binding protein [Thiohalocapsa sp.]
MKIGIIGGTGFVGSYVLDALARDGHSMRVLTRPGSEYKLPALPDIESVTGDVADEDAVRACFEGCDGAIYLIGILREEPSRGVTFDALQRRGAERAMAAAEEVGATRFLLMSANGVDAAATPYQVTKLAAEEALKASTLEWTIFRPSVIFGPPRGRMEFCTQLKRDIIDSPLPAPLFYSGWLPTDAGAFQLGPVHAEDVAAAFAKALTTPETIGRTLELCGPDAWSWKKILAGIAAAAGKNKLMLPAPVMFIGPVATVMGRFAWFPITGDQLTMLLAGNTCVEDGFAPLGIIPRPFDPDTLAYLRQED